MSLTMTWAVRPDSAWLKWDWAFATVVFAVFMPFVFRSRVQIEAMLQVFILGSSMHLLAVGIKGALTGGGYNMHLTVLPADTGLAESSAMATVAVMMILLSLQRHSLLFPWPLLRKAFYVGFCFLCLTATIATGARTGLVCMALLAAIMWMGSRLKIVSALAMVILALALLAIAPPKWVARMDTIDDFRTETSSLTRLLMWEWSLKFVSDNPFGGGFRAYEVSVIHMPASELNPEGFVQRGRATHNTAFEIMTELGYVGIAIFAALIANFYAALLAVRRRTAGIAELEWARDLGMAMMKAMPILIVGSIFIGIAFKPWYWLMFAAATCLSECVRRCLAPEARQPFEDVRQRMAAASASAPAGARKPALSGPAWPARAGR
jgi:probable O-glycosylation ligase (exosortase A-associated)